LSPLVVDNNTLVYAWQMRALAWPPLPIVEAMLRRGLRLLTTKKVRGEMSVSCEHVASAWEQEGWLQTIPVTRQDVRQLRNLSRRPEPGEADLGLIALAWRQRAPLLTHDAPAQHYALDRAIGVLVIDMVDLLAAAATLGLIELGPLSDAWGAEPHPSWQRPAAWQGSVMATMVVRTAMEPVVRELTRGLDA
jgi:predicted nucleic acid-binding protein